MFKKRALIVKLDKAEPKNALAEDTDIRPIEIKAGAVTGTVLKKFEKVGWKVFGCVCVYVLLDTVRQVAVARASQPYPETEEEN